MHLQHTTHTVMFAGNCAVTSDLIENKSTNIHLLLATNNRKDNSTPDYFT